ncbi:hypothetical protein HanIR_Chr16g0829881 [Helianthus annuus]|nr:hypothetical protein HanIR_Chr16g0829881 [Helianthus annuus]
MHEIWARIPLQLELHQEVGELSSFLSQNGDGCTQTKCLVFFPPPHSYKTSSLLPTFSPSCSFLIYLTPIVFHSYLIANFT